MKTILKKLCLIALAMGLLTQTRTHAMQEVLEYTDPTYSYAVIGGFAVAYFVVEWYRGVFDVPQSAQRSHSSRVVSPEELKKDQKKENESLRIQAMRKNASTFEEKKKVEDETEIKEEK